MSSVIKRASSGRVIEKQKAVETANASFSKVRDFNSYIYCLRTMARMLLEGDNACQSYHRDSRHHCCRRAVRRILALSQPSIQMKKAEAAAPILSSSCPSTRLVAGLTR
jgi:hypothetical protein